MADLTTEQAAEVKRLVEAGLTETEATELVLQPVFDVPLGADGKATVPLVSSEPISLPPPLLP